MIFLKIPRRILGLIFLVFVAATIAVTSIFYITSTPDKIAVVSCKKGLTAVGNPQVCIRIHPGTKQQTELFVRHGQLLAMMNKAHPAYIYFDEPQPLTELSRILLPLQASCERVIAHTKPIDINSTVSFDSIPCSNVEGVILSALNDRLSATELNPKNISITETLVEVNAVLVVAPADVLLKFWQDRPELVRAVSFAPTIDSNPLGFNYPARFKSGK